MTRTCFVLLSILLLFGYARPQTETLSLEQEKVKSYLEATFKSTYNDYANLHDEFSRFLSLDAALEKELVQEFPEYRFLLAETFFTHWIPRDNKAAILAVSDSKTGEPIAFAWALGYSTFSESFTRILEPVLCASDEDAKKKFVLLARLIASNSWRAHAAVGGMRVNGQSMEIELGTSWTRIMSVKYDKGRYGKITFLNPKENKFDESFEERSRRKMQAANDKR